jgi:hypothetical protein
VKIESLSFKLQACEPNNWIIRLMTLSMDRNSQAAKELLAAP